MAISDGGSGNALFNAMVAGFQKLAPDGTNSAFEGYGSGSAHGPDVREQQNLVTRNTSWIMTTTEWLTGANKNAIRWHANPSSVSWSMPIRGEITKNLYGTVFHAWANSNRHTYYDEFRLTLNLQSGNLMPVRVGPAPIFDWVPAKGIVNFFEFMKLVDAPKLFTDTSTTPNSVRANLVNIQYYSPKFPSFTLVGMFDPSGIRFEDSSQDPNQVTNWSVDFIVYDTFPRLSSNNSNTLNNNQCLDNWLNNAIKKNPKLNFQDPSQQHQSVSLPATNNSTTTRNNPPQYSASFPQFPQNESAIKNAQSNKEQFSAQLPPPVTPPPQQDFFSKLFNGNNEQ